MLVQDKVSAMDQMSRESLNDKSADFLGNVRGLQLANGLSMDLCTKTNLQIHAELAKSGKLALFADSTGDIVQTPDIPSLKEKILRTKFIVAPKTALVKAEWMRDINMRRMLSPVLVAEIVSNVNKADDFSSFLTQFHRDADAVGAQSEKLPPPLLCLSDNAA